MLDRLLTSRTRIRLLLKLFLNPQVTGYLRELAQEFGQSPAALKEELDSLSQAGYLTRRQRGRSVYFGANTAHPFFPELHSMVKKTLGFDALLDDVLKSLGRVDAAWVLDDYAQGRDSGLIDLLVVGAVDRARLDELVRLAEGKIRRRVRVLALEPDEFAKSRELFLSRPNWKLL